MHTELGIQTDTIHSEQQNELIASNKTTGWPIARCELANGQRLSRVGVASPASSAMDGVGAGGVLRISDAMLSCSVSIELDRVLLSIRGLWAGRAGRRDSQVS